GPVWCSGLFAPYPSFAPSPRQGAALGDRPGVVEGSRPRSRCQLLAGPMPDGVGHLPRQPFERLLPRGTLPRDRAGDEPDLMAGNAGTGPPGQPPQGPRRAAPAHGVDDPAARPLLPFGRLEDCGHVAVETPQEGVAGPAALPGVRRVPVQREQIL